MPDRSALVLLVFVSIVLVAVGSGFASAQPKNASTHTLVITSTNGSASYAVSTSGSLKLKSGEPSDHTVQNNQVGGTVGTSGDQKDVIQYSGYVRSFDSQGVQVRLNGKQVSSDALAGNHIKIIHPTNASGESVQYQFPLKGGTATHGELAEKNDVANEQTIRGSIGSGADSFYFTGDIPDKAFNGLAKVRINGQPAEKFTKNPPPTPSATPTTTSSPTTTTATPTTSAPSPTTDGTTITTPSSGVNTTAQEPQSGSNSSNNTFLIGFATGILLLIGGGIAGLFYLDRQ